MRIQVVTTATHNSKVMIAMLKALADIKEMEWNLDVLYAVFFSLSFFVSLLWDQRKCSS
jgi:hypothetical protein